MCQGLTSEGGRMEDVPAETNSAAAVECTEDIEVKSGSNKKIAFLFDSTLTAYLMMGNLSPSLKNHAVTMFEVGKLSEEVVKHMDI